MSKNWVRAILVFFGASTLLLLLIAPGFHEAFFPIDDHGLFYQAYLKNPWNWNSFITIWTPGNSADYYPIRDMTVWIDWSFSRNLRVDTTVPQIQNYLWLVATAGILFQILNLYCASCLVSALFASAWLLHPFHFESLHWISARKDLLSWFFMAAAAYSFIQLQKDSRLRLVIITCVLFLLSMLSKANFLAVPFALIAWFSIEQFLFKKSSPRRVWIALFAASLLSLSIILVNYWNYTTSNYMQMTEESPVRIQSVLAAFGRNILGIFIPTYNAVDVEPWGGWVSHNTAFIPLGLVGVILLLGLGIYSFKKGQSRLRLYLALLVAVLLMTPGFNPKHRNYYSIRYFEPILFICWIWGASYFSSRMREKAILPFLLCLFFAGSALWDSNSWNSNYDILNKSYQINPTDPALRSMLMFELFNLDTWGRLTSIQKLNFLKLYEENIKDCIDTSETNGRCLVFWVRLNPILKKLASSVEDEIRIRQVALQKMEIIKSSTFSEVAPAEIAWTQFHAKLDSGVLDTDLLNLYFTGHTSLTDDIMRIPYLILKCKEHGPNYSKQKYQAWIKQFLIDPDQVFEFISNISNQELRHQVQICFGTLKGR